MELQILSNLKGDKTLKINTRTKAGRAEAEKVIKEMLSNGSALFLERQEDGEIKTYRVTGYDPETDKFFIRADQPVPDSEPVKDGKTVKVSAKGAKVTSAAPQAGG